MSLLDATIQRISPQDQAARDKAKSRLDQLIMPHWALGRLMDLAMDLAGMTGSARPPTRRKTIVTMAGDHGVVAEGVSKYPQEVTRQMVLSFVSGRAGINALSRLNDTQVVVVDMGVAGDLTTLVESGEVLSRRVAEGTQNMANGPAMSREQALKAVEAGIEVAEQLGPSVDLFGTGDMGIGNTTPSAAVGSILTGTPVSEMAGRGTGLDDREFEHKVAVIERAIKQNEPNPNDALDVLSKVGGFEIGGIAGLILGAAARRKPVLLDGFISTAGALLADVLAPSVRGYIIAAHRSMESGHRQMQRHLGTEPLLDLNLRLGEGTGAALAMNLVEAAARLLTEVDTFDEASVSKAQS